MTAPLWILNGPNLNLHWHSITSGAATAVIAGPGTCGCIVAMQSAARMAGTIPKGLPEPIRTGPV